ncbi:hypothetical protein NL676_014051 [Syzygium grande]|nr:hypothetical protein NL676_014051 [Syzygium grande]
MDDQESQRLAFQLESPSNSPFEPTTYYSFLPYSSSSRYYAAENVVFERLKGEELGQTTLCGNPFGSEHDQESDIQLR